jgi:hypothetical protein
LKACVAANSKGSGTADFGPPDGESQSCPLDFSSILFLTREAAVAELREILHDEPDWKDVLRVVPIELDGRNVSPN